MKKLFIIAGIIALLLIIIKRKDMTWRQSVLKLVYPLIMKFTKNDNEAILANKKNSQPFQSLYDLHATKNNGEQFRLDTFKGKKILLVNTASDCGYTDQYEDLQKLQELQKNNLIVLGFPANDFKEQEGGSDEEIAQFCKSNYGVTFPLMKKSSVIKGIQQNEVFHWLSDKAKNGWNDQQPQWNFSKYLVNEQGLLTNYFGPAVSPLDKKVIAAIEK